RCSYPTSPNPMHKKAPGATHRGPVSLMSHQLAKEDEQKLTKVRRWPQPSKPRHRGHRTHLWHAPATAVRRAGIISSGSFLTGPMLYASRTNNERMLLSTMNGGWRGAGAWLALCCSLFFAAQCCEAQNLVPNHSFEEYDDCLEVNMAYTLGTGPLGWFSAGGTGDFFLS